MLAPGRPVCVARFAVGLEYRNDLDDSHVGRCSSAQDRGDAGFQILTRRRPRSPGNPQKRGVDFRTSPHDMCAVGLERSRPAFPRHFAQALHFARSPGRGLLAKCHPRPDVRKQVSRAFDNRPVSCRAAKRCLTPLQGDEICLVPINLVFLGPPSKSNTLEEPIQIPRCDCRSH